MSGGYVPCLFRAALRALRALSLITHEPSPSYSAFGMLFISCRLLHAARHSSSRHPTGND